MTDHISGKLDDINKILVRNTVILENVSARLEKHHDTLYDPETGISTRITVMETRKQEDDKNLKKNMMVVGGLGGTGLLGFLISGWQMVVSSFKSGG